MHFRNTGLPKLTVALALGLGFLLASGCRPRAVETTSDLANFTKANAVAPVSYEDTPVFGGVDFTGNRNLKAGIPAFPSKKPSDASLIISRSQFVVNFSVSEKIPRWTAWQITDKDLGSIDRDDNTFKADDILNGYLAAKYHDLGVKPVDYTNSCFDRGHQSAAKDRSNSERNTDATFLMSNIAPQTAFLNRIIWAKFEAHSRKLVEDSGKRAQVISGAILKDGRDGIGASHEISVPESFFKIVVVYPSLTSTTPTGYIAVIMPNVTANGLDPLANRKVNCDEQKLIGPGTMSRNWEDYRATLDTIEKKTGLRFDSLKKLDVI